ncbi:MAG: hypothetical protein WCB31_08535 [Nitrososphaeraceae archaeon]
MNDRHCPLNNEPGSGLLGLNDLPQVAEYITLRQEKITNRYNNQICKGIHIFNQNIELVLYLEENDVIPKKI